MRYLRQEIPGVALNLYPIVCWHIGARQSSLPFIQKVIRSIKEDPIGRWIYMGDAGECILRSSKGSVYEQLISPGEQLKAAVELLMPIKEKGMFGIRGNHGNRIDKETGVGWDETLCTLVSIPYMGIEALAQLQFESHRKSAFVSLYAHHGRATATTPGGKMNAAHKPEAFVAADIILTAHTHVAGEAWPSKLMAYIHPRKREVQWMRMRSFVCGSAYDSRVEGYATEAMLPPLMPEHLRIRIKMSQRHGGKPLSLGVAYDKIELEGI